MLAFRPSARDPRRRVTFWRSLRFCLSGAIVGCACLSATATALAQGARPDVDQRARGLFEEGRLAYDAGDDEEALAHFKAAHDLSHRPELLYNIGLSADRLGRIEEALVAYRGYLEQLPDAHNRVSVADRIRALEAMTAPKGAPPETPAPAAVEPELDPEMEKPPEELERGVPVLPLVVVGVGTVVLGVGVGFGLSAQSGEDDYAAAPVTTGPEVNAAAAKLADAERDANTANILFAIGGSVFVGGAAWLAVELLGDSPSGAEATAWIDHDVTGIRVRGAWGSDRW